MFPASGEPLQVVAWYVRNTDCELAEPRFGFIVEKGTFSDLRARAQEFHDCAEQTAAASNFHIARTLAGWSAAFAIGAILAAAGRREFDIDELKALPTLPRGNLSRPELAKLVAAYLFVASSSDRARDAVDEGMIAVDMPESDRHAWLQFQHEHWRNVRRHLSAVLQALARAAPR
jgi:hypothetical protein